MAQTFLVNYNVIDSHLNKFLYINIRYVRKNTFRRAIVIMIKHEY